MLLRWTAAAFAAIALAGLLTRLLPDVFPISSGFLPERVSFPLTYWNAMGVACALGAVLVLHLTASGREHAIVRVVAAALLPPIAVTLYLTFSRGAIWVLPLGFVLYVLLAQPRGLLTGLPAAGIPAALAVEDRLRQRAAGARGLRHLRGRREPGPPRRRWSCWPAPRAPPRCGPRRCRWTGGSRRSRSRRTTGASCASALSGGLVIALLLGALAADAPRRISDARATFSEGRYMDYSADLRTRLTSAVDNGRIDNWRVALDGFDAQPLHGTGAGTYRITWDADRPAPPIKVNDGHSLYLEVLSELGVVGLVLLLVALGTPLVVAAARLGGPERHAHGAFLAAGVMLLAHAAIDWDWEMPALFVWFFGAGGVVLAAREARLGELGRTPRIVAALAVLVLALTPALFAYSQAPLDRALNAFARRDCDVGDRRRADRHGALRHASGAVDGARLLRRARWASSSSPGARWTPPAARDPDNWQYAYGQAIVYGVSGRRSAAVRRRGAAAQPARPAGAARSCATCGRAKTEARRREVTRRAGIPLE